MQGRRRGPAPVNVPGAQRSSLPLAALAVLLCSTVALAENVGMRSVETGEIPVSIVFYADASCLLTIDHHSSVGKTEIDADVGAGGSRMFIHCDTDEGHRLTMHARGERLERDARVALLSRVDIESGADGVIAWQTRAGASPVDESVPRRYVARGHVVIRETTAVQADGTALHGERMAFARLDGELERRAARPNSTEALPAD